MDHPSISPYVITLLLAVVAGCGTSRMTDTTRTGLEQLLISTAVDRSLDAMDFSSLAGRAVYVQEKYLDCVDKNYVVACVRHRALNAGARLVDKPEEADLVLEVRNGSVGTDRMEAYVGVPGISLPPPVAITLPDLKLANRTSQKGIAKLGLAAYDAKTGQALGAGGSALARSIDNNWYILGIGPFNTGNLSEEIDAAKGTLQARLGIDPASRSAMSPPRPAPEIRVEGPLGLPQPAVASPLPAAGYDGARWLR